MNMLMCVQKPHQEESRWNVSFRINWWHYWAYGGWKWPGSTPMLIQHWHNKVSVHLAREAELASAARNYFDQMLTTNHALSSFSVKILHCQFVNSGDSHFPLFPFTYIARLRQEIVTAPPAKTPCVLVSTVIVKKSVFGWNGGDTNEGTMTGEMWLHLASGVTNKGFWQKEKNKRKEEWNGGDKWRALMMPHPPISFHPAPVLVLREVLFCHVSYNFSYPLMWCTWALLPILHIHLHIFSLLSFSCVFVGYI